MVGLGKMLLLVAAIVAVLGLILWGLGRLGFKGLPGDILYRGENVTVYFPIVTSIVLSILLTTLLWLWQRFFR